MRSRGPAPLPIFRSQHQAPGRTDGPVGTAPHAWPRWGGMCVDTEENGETQDGPGRRPRTTTEARCGIPRTI
ncbi:hypothetical protein [Ornithinimicrobium kibberense]|uniref:hypothetical protein n=1 Tax=Ornithinimicrobium kibberense TaxID=282060 RepID=UPI003609FF1D